MSNLIERPSFYEGQILGAADLESGTAHARGQLARHERYLHLWGIAEGLELVGADKKTATDVAYQEVTLTAGIAIDGTGREVVVPEDTLLSEELFDQLNVAVESPLAPGEEPPWYPVFLTGRDAVAAAPALTIGQCGAGAAARYVEGYEIGFGRPGDASFDDPDPSPVSAGPGGSETGPRWPILVGFVQWTDGRFTASRACAGDVCPRYAGVRADVIAARMGALSLRTTSELEPGKAALLLHATKGFEFGPATAAGGVTPLLSVDMKGNLTVAGKIQGAVTPGSTHVQSGSATDGTLLPLPPGITQELIAEGKAVLHVQISARIPGSAPPNATDTWGAFPLECFVDADRRVHCSTRWFKLSGAGTTNVVDSVSLCDYIVIAAVPAAEGVSP